MVFTWRCRYSRMSALASVSTSASPSGSLRNASLISASPASTAIASAKSSRGPAAAPKCCTSRPASCSAMIVLLSRSASSRCTSTTSPKCSVRNPGTSRCIAMYSSMAASTTSHQWAYSTWAERASSRARYASRLRSARAWTIARLSGKNWCNWAGNQRDTAETVTPRGTAEVAALVKQAHADGRTVKPVGSGHSFTAAALTEGVRLRLDHLAGLVAVHGKLVTVQAGMPLSVLNRVLAEHRLALPNLGDIDVQTVAGALATGTHGTGARLGCLSTFVESLTFVDGTGTVVRSTSGDGLFDAVRVGVGALGVLTEVTLRCVDAFVLRADEGLGRVDEVFAEIGRA